MRKLRFLVIIMMPNQELEIYHDSLSYYLFLQYLINVYPEERGFTVMIPDLPGCMSQGATLDEVIINIKKAQQLWLKTVYATDVKSIPLPSELVK